jgi:mono/diheme cytochrome c family protein
LGAALLGAFSVQAKDVPKLPPPADQKDVTYAKVIRPLFERSCFKCHGEEKQKGKLRLDSLEAVLKGADGDQVIIPGKSSKSKLVQAVAHATEDEDEWMPPPDKAKELTPEEVGLIRAWIDQGAK